MGLPKTSSCCSEKLRCWGVFARFGAFAATLTIFYACIGLSHCVRTEKSKKPRAIVHIGPPKTATSYTQSILGSPMVASRMAADKNTFWPMYPTTTAPYHQPIFYKGMNDLALYMVYGIHTNFSRLPRPLESIQRFINESLELKRNIIISAESFYLLPKNALRELRDGVLRGFDITIVLNYREWLSLYVSVYFERQRTDFRRGRSVNTFARYLTTREKIRTLETLDVLDEILDLFGRGEHRVVVIDYYGAKAAGKDLAYILACEIAGVLCNRKTGKFDPNILKAISNGIHDNPRYAVSRELFFSFVKDFLRIKYLSIDSASVRVAEWKWYFHQVVSAGSLPESQRFVSSLYTKYEFIATHGILNGTEFLPTVNVSLSFLASHSLILDTRLRHVLSGAATGSTGSTSRDLSRVQLLYGNATANMEAAHHNSDFVELDIEALKVSPIWLKWVNDFVWGQFNEYKSKKQLPEPTQNITEVRLAPKLALNHQHKAVNAKEKKRKGKKNDQLL